MKNEEYDPAEEWLAKRFLEDRYLAYDKNTATNNIKRIISEHIEELLFKSGQTKPPFNPRALFDATRIIEFYEATLPDNISGLLVPILGGFKMKINSSHGEVRKRYSIAHEVGHTFFYNLNDYAIPKLDFNVENSRYWLREGYANEIASMILLPESFIKEHIRVLNLLPSFESIERICKTYRVSFQAAIRRIIRTMKLWDCLIFMSEKNGSNINTIKASIIKGQSFTKFVMSESIATQIRENLNNAYEDGQSCCIFSYKGRTFHIHTKRMNVNNTSILYSIITLNK
jgi:Zn-dependent peptidase ImmA (M78 family)